MNKMEVWANMSVKDIGKTRNFFEHLGFKVNGGRDNKDIASFIFSEDHFVIHFFREESFKEASGNAISDTSAGSEVMFTIAADSNAAVGTYFITTPINK